MGLIWAVPLAQKQVSASETMSLARGFVCQDRSLQLNVAIVYFIPCGYNKLEEPTPISLIKLMSHYKYTSLVPWDLRAFPNVGYFSDCEDFRTGFSRNGSVGLTVGLNDLRGLFRP